MNSAYVEKTFGDGDKKIYSPYWREVLQNELPNMEPDNLERKIDKWKFIDEKEIALKHPNTGATIKLGDDGSIEMFVSEDTGFRLDPKDNAIIFYGDSVHFASKEIRMHTKPYGLIWNNHNVNPYLYYGEKRENVRSIPTVPMTVSSGTHQLPVFQEQTRRQYYDKKVNSIIEELGIETAITRRGG